MPDEPVSSSSPSTPGRVASLIGEVETASVRRASRVFTDPSSPGPGSSPSPPVVTRSREGEDSEGPEGEDSEDSEGEDSEGPGGEADKAPNQQPPNQPRGPSTHASAQTHRTGLPIDTDEIAQILQRTEHAIGADEHSEDDDEHSEDELHGGYRYGKVEQLHGTLTSEMTAIVKAKGELGQQLEEHDPKMENLLKVLQDHQAMKGRLDEWHRVQEKVDDMVRAAENDVNAQDETQIQMSDIDELMDKYSHYPYPLQQLLEEKQQAVITYAKYQLARGLLEANKGPQFDTGSSLHESFSLANQREELRNQSLEATERESLNQSLEQSERERAREKKLRIVSERKFANSQQEWDEERQRLRSGGSSSCRWRMCLFGKQ